MGSLTAPRATLRNRPPQHLEHVDLLVTYFSKVGWLANAISAEITRFVRLGFLQPAMSNVVAKSNVVRDSCDITLFWRFNVVQFATASEVTR